MADARNTHDTPAPTAGEVLAALRAMGSEANRAGMARYAINVEHAFGISMTSLRTYARTIGKNHLLALALWESGYHEARLLAGLVDERSAITREQMEHWVSDFDSWDVCDQVASGLFARTPHAWDLVPEWCGSDAEWRKRAGFALIVGITTHDRRVTDEALLSLFPLIEAGAFDERNFVKKAVSWALRTIGKRNPALNVAAVSCAERLLETANHHAGGPRGGTPEVRAARWVANDVLRELRSETVRARLAERATRAAVTPGRSPRAVSAGLRGRTRQR